MSECWYILAQRGVGYVRALSLQFCMDCAAELLPATYHLHSRSTNPTQPVLSMYVELQALQLLIGNREVS